MVPNFAYFLGVGALLMLAGAGVTYKFWDKFQLSPPQKPAKFALLTLMIFGAGFLALGGLDYFDVIKRHIHAAADSGIELNFNGTDYMLKKGGNPVTGAEFKHVEIPGHPEATSFEYYVHFPGTFASSPCVSISVHSLSGRFSRFDIQAKDVNATGFTIIFTLWVPIGTKTGERLDIPAMHADMLDQLTIDWTAIQP